MSQKKPKEAPQKTSPSKGPTSPPAPTSQPQPPPPSAIPPNPPPLFRRIDWLTFGLTTLLVFIGYWLTLSPDLTLEDSGELAVGSFYCGVPHPPGYPVWTIYSWLFTVLVPVSNIAYRVALSSAVAGALSCGLVALMVSRGSSMMIEGMASLKAIEQRWENILCVVSGFVAGMLIGFNGFMWSQAVIVEVYTLSVLSLSGILVCLLRWIYAPHQHRYLYLAFFWFGITFNNHQSLLVTIIGIEATALFVQPKIGRELFFWNTLIWIAGIIGRKLGYVGTLNDNVPLFIIYNLIGISSAAIWISLTLKTKKSGIELLRDAALLGCILYLVVLLLSITHYITFFQFKTSLFVLFNLMGLACVGAFVYLILQTTRLGREWIAVLLSGGSFMLGAAFYLYMPLASMTNPPMNWGYPRTVTGFFHAFTRGQYERIHPTTGTGDTAIEMTASFVTRVSQQIGMYIGGAVEEFNLVYLLIGLIPLAFFLVMQKRERAWIICLFVTYLTLSLFLLILLNPAPDRQSRDLNRVFFTASHVIIAMGVGYGLTLIGALLATQYERFRLWGVQAAIGAAALALISFGFVYESTSMISIGVGILVTLLGTLIALHKEISRNALITASSALSFILLGWLLRAPFLIGLGFAASLSLLGLLAAAQREHLRKYLIYGATLLSTLIVHLLLLLLYGGSPLILQGLMFDLAPSHEFFTRFTALFSLLLALAAIVIFWMFRSRVPLAALLILFSFMPLRSILAHWYNNEQRGHLFGYWFGHDMFTPPFDIYPEMPRDTILFGGTDPGRFNPTYMIFCESFLPDSKKRDPNFDRRDVYLITQNALADGTYLSYIRAHYNRSTQIDPPFFQELLRGPTEIEANYTTNILARAVGPIDRLFTRLGEKVEERRRRDGVYPITEIHTPSNEESQRSFQEYLADAQRRHQLKQLKPGEDVKIIENRVQVSGQVAVMAINALLTKVIFDANPDHEFYVEESFPLDWMYPHLTPFGIIMKMNREPIPEITEEMVAKDHEFWSKYSDRLIGNWITYDTSVSNICAFAEQTYYRRDNVAFQGDPKFLRDSDGQKAFSKLRSSIAGVYNWRINNITSQVQGLQRLSAGERIAAQDKVQQLAAEQQRMVKEAEFAFKQAYAFCPYSPEAIFRFVNLLAGMQPPRIDEALLLATTSQKLDPFNGQLDGLVRQLQGMQAQQASLNIPPPPPPAATQLRAQISQLQAKVRANPADTASAALAVQLLDTLTASPNIDAASLLFAARAYSELAQPPKVESTLAKLLRIDPNNPEAWFDLAAMQALLNKPDQAVGSLRQALQQSRQRLAANPSAPNLYSNAILDARFTTLRPIPDFQKLLAELKP